MIRTQETHILYYFAALRGKTASKSSKSKRAAKKPKGKKEQEMFDDL